MSLSIHKVSVTNPVEGFFFATPWEYQASMFLGKKEVSIGFRSKSKINELTLEISKERTPVSSTEVRKEFIIKVIEPDTVNMSQIKNLPPYRLDISKSSSRECVLYKIVETGAKE